MASATRADTSSRNQKVEEGRMELGAGQEAEEQASPTPVASPEFRKARNSREVQSRYMQAPGAAALQARRRTVANHSLQRDSGHIRIPIPHTKGRDSFVRTVDGRQGTDQSKPLVVKAKSIRSTSKDGGTESGSPPNMPNSDKRPSTSPTRSKHTPKDTQYTPQSSVRGLDTRPPSSGAGRSLETVVYSGRPASTPRVESISTPRSAPPVVSKAAGEVTKAEWEDAIAVSHNRWLHFVYANGKVEARRAGVEEAGAGQVWGAMEAVATLREEVGELEARVGRREVERKARNLVDRHQDHLAEWRQLGGPGRAVLRDALSAIRGSTLRLPLVGHVTAEAHELRAAMESANEAFTQLGSTVSALHSTAAVLSTELSRLSSSGGEEGRVVAACGKQLVDLALAEVRQEGMKARRVGWG